MTAELGWGDIQIAGVDKPAVSVVERKPKAPRPKTLGKAKGTARVASRIEAEDFQLRAPEQGPRLYRQPKPPAPTVEPARTHALPKRESAPVVDSGSLEDAQRFRRMVFERVAAAKRAGWKPELYTKRQLRDIGLILASGHPVTGAVPFHRRSPTVECTTHGPRLEMAVDATELQDGRVGIRWCVAPCFECEWGAA